MFVVVNFYELSKACFTFFSFCLLFATIIMVNRDLHNDDDDKHGCGSSDDDDNDAETV